MIHIKPRKKIKSENKKIELILYFFMY